MVRGVSWTLLASALALPALGVTFSSSTRAYPIAAGRDLGPPVAALEAAASKDSSDARALARLAAAYLERDAAGLAEAAIARAPEATRSDPEVASLRTHTLAALGNVPGALVVGRALLRTCQMTPETCAPQLHARTERRVAWLTRMTELGVDDAHADPAGAMLAYRLTSREVRLDVR